MSTPLLIQPQPGCERCGRCLQVCPSWLKNGVETFSPRGRLELLRALASGELAAPGPRYAASLGSCLQCLACHEACPKGIDAPALIRQGKSSLYAERRGPHHTLERMALSLLLSRGRLFAALTTGIARLQQLFQRGKKADVRHLPTFLPKMVRGRRIPSFSRKSLSALLPEEIHPPAETPVKGRVTLFPGCWSACAETTPAEAAVEVLRHNGYIVRLDRRQTCCGAPSLLGGYPEIARKNATQNLALLEGEEPVITICATCGTALKHDMQELFSPEEPQYKKAVQLSPRVQDFTSFLAQQPLTLGPGSVNTTITIHDSCHHNRGLGGAPQLRNVLQQVPGLTLKEMEDSTRCCGGGGLCALNNPQLSKELGEKKTDSILASQAALVTSPCPGCLLQIAEGLSHRKTAVTVRHPAEILADTFSRDTPSAQNRSEHAPTHLFQQENRT